MPSPFDLKVAECPYLPPGWALLEGIDEFICLNTANGDTVKVPKFPKLEFETHFRKEFERVGDRLIGHIDCWWRFR